MAVDEVLTNSINFRWDESTQRLFVTDANRTGESARIAQVDLSTLDKMTWVEASAFIGNFVTLFVPTLRSRYSTDDRARLHLTMHQAVPALADLDEALRLEPTLAEARSARADVRRSMGDQPGAQSDLQQLDAALPPAAPLRADMAQLYARLHQVPEALRQFELWINSHPKDARRSDALNNRCWMRTRFNVELALALRDCNEAIDIDAGSASYRDSLGWTYLRMGDAVRAKKAFENAIKLNDSAPFSFYGRALARRQLNETTGSEQDFAAARKLKASIDEDVRKEGFEFSDATTGMAAPGLTPDSLGH